jgi:hypothetical protein
MLPFAGAWRVDFGIDVVYETLFLQRGERKDQLWSLAIDCEKTLQRKSQNVCAERRLERPRYGTNGNLFATRAAELTKDRPGLTAAVDHSLQKIENCRSRAYTPALRIRPSRLVESRNAAMPESGLFK